MSDEQQLNMRIYHFAGKSGHIIIEIGKSVEFGAKKVPHLGTVRESFVSNKVIFNYLGFSFDNAFQALSSLETLTTIFIRRKFGQHTHKSYLRFVYEKKMYGMTAEKIPQGNGQLPLLKLGIENSDRHVVMTEAYALQANTTLRKALNWLAPAHGE